VLLHRTSIGNIFILSIPLYGIVSHQDPIFEKLKPVFMKTRNFTPVGSLHPILFFAVVYMVALVFSIFICSTLFYSCNAKSASFGEEKTIPMKNNNIPADQLAAK
jgi:hypothetical protein